MSGVSLFVGEVQARSGSVPGPVERRGESLGDGLERLREDTEEYAGLGPHQLSDALRSRREPDPRDDIAMLTLRVAEGP